MKLKSFEREYLNAQLDNFSIYRKKFIEETNHDDIQMAILRAHMYIEKEMVELTNIYFKYPSKFRGYKFKSRLDLLFALGVIDKELYDPINKINEIRNEISHELDFEFTEKQYKRLFDSLSKEILKEFKADLELAEKLSNNLSYIDKTRILLAGIWTSIKADVLTSFLGKKDLAMMYNIQATDELMHFFKKEEIK